MYSMLNLVCGHEAMRCLCEITNFFHSKSRWMYIDGLILRIVIDNVTLSIKQFKVFLADDGIFYRCIG